MQSFQVSESLLLNPWIRRVLTLPNRRKSLFPNSPVSSSLKRRRRKLIGPPNVTVATPRDEMKSPGTVPQGTEATVIVPGRESGGGNTGITVTPTGKMSILVKRLPSHLHPS